MGENTTPNVQFAPAAKVLGEAGHRLFVMPNPAVAVIVFTVTAVFPLFATVTVLAALVVVGA